MNFISRLCFVSQLAERMSIMLDEPSVSVNIFFLSALGHLSLNAREKKAAALCGRMLSVKVRG
jgi:hypothetical protein